MQGLSICLLSVSMKRIIFLNESVISADFDYFRYISVYCQGEENQK